MTSDELWRDIDIPNFEGFYQISSFGRVKTVKARRGATIGKILKPRDNRGYLNVSLANGITRKKFGLSRLVALAFVPNPETKPQVNHINGIKTDNRPENLEWVTASENTYHMWASGLKRQRVHSSSHKEKICQTCRRNWKNQYSRSDK